MKKRESLTAAVQLQSVGCNTRDAVCLSLCRNSPLFFYLHAISDRRPIANLHSQKVQKQNLKKSRDVVVAP